MILSDARLKIAEYNRLNLHYNLIADGIYAARRRLDPFSPDFQPYIVAGLIGFDLGRMMGAGAEFKYDPRCGGFATVLSKLLGDIEPWLRPYMEASLEDVELGSLETTLEKAYSTLLQIHTKGFHVGVTKILHWIGPEMFVIIDRNTARAFREHHQISFTNGQQPGYTSKKYHACLEKAQGELLQYPGLRSYEPGTPLARIFDKAAFMSG